jgi:PAS domain S-box-containing protein
MVVLTRDGDAALADWSDQAGLVGSFAASALLMTWLLTLRNAREQALRRASEAALAAEQARAVRAFQAAQEGHWEWNPLTGQSHLSPRMKELLGMDRDEARAARGGEVDLLALDSLHPDDRGPLQQAFVDHQQGRTPELDCSFRVRHADGRWHRVRARGHAWRDPAGEAVLFSGTASDITAEAQALAQQQQLEEQLQRARKLEALGTLAGGVAHDFNNILAAVIGYGELARASATDGSGQARQLDQVLRAGQRGKALVERILSFSRSAPRAHTRFRLQPVIDEVLQLLATSLPPQVRLEHHLQAPEAVIAGDATMVYEAAMNLCSNAMQALQGQPGGGCLRVELTLVQVDAPKALFEGRLAPGRHACLSVSDDGPGIAPEVKSRLFEPFFTTKGPQQGTGLGLSVVRGVMHDLGGAIELRSAPGRGTRFALYFPCVDAPPQGPQPADTATPLGQGQTVLVVDDEPALVELAEELLAGLGYEPVGFASSAQALAAVRADPRRFDLVLTDEVMPELTGTALAGALRELRPDLPILLASGYGGPQLDTRARAAGISVVVRKPLRRAELAQALSQALQAGARPPDYS